ncbi:MAG: TRAP transporter small permease [Deltaproteobacteria bacterium]|nr:TRAP transporter small permease [Deltaproteobacteria bacterium]
MQGYEWLDRFFVLLERVQMVFCTGALAVMVVIMSLEILLRHLAGINLQWGLDLSALLMVWTCFIGMSMVYRRKGHIGIEALVRFFPLGFQRALNTCLYLLIGGSFIILMVKAASLVWVQRSQEIVSLSIPRSYLSAPLFIGALLMGLTSIHLSLGEILGVEPKGPGFGREKKGESDESN